MATRGTILVADDTPAIADLLRATLAAAGYRVLVAPTVAIGLQILRAFQVGLVLTAADHPASENAGDIWLDLDRLAHAAGAAPLVLYTPDEPHRYSEHAAHGFAACLTKPLDLDVLLTTVGSLLLVEGQHPTVAQGFAPTREG